MSGGVRLFWSLFVLAMAVYLAMILWTLPAIMRAAGGLAPFDLRPGGYSVDEARAFLDALGADGRATYLGPQALLDLVYPALLAATLIVGFRLLLRRPALWIPAGLLAVAASGFDWLENLRVRGLLTADMPGDAAILGASFATVAKSVLSSVAFAALLLAGSFRLWVWRRRGG